jgi:putative endonuclease
VKRDYYVYFLANVHHTVLYVGITNDLLRRVTEHREKRVEGFTKRYNVTKLVYFESFPDAATAIEREKQLKAGSRRKKLDLIEQQNPEWEDLYLSLIAE